MTKTYFCKKITEQGVVCGERDVSKFIEGRYTTCKSCRLRVMSDYNKTKTNKKKNDEIQKLDPDCNIRWVIEDTIINVPLIDRQTLPYKIQSNEEEIENLSTRYYCLENLAKTKFHSMQNEIDNLKKYIDILEQKMEDLNK